MIAGDDCEGQGQNDNTTSPRLGTTIIRHGRHLVRMPWVCWPVPHGYIENQKACWGFWGNTISHQMFYWISVGCPSGPLGEDSLNHFFPAEVTLGAFKGLWGRFSEMTARSCPWTTSNSINKAPRRLAELFEFRGMEFMHPITVSRTSSELQRGKASSP